MTTQPVSPGERIAHALRIQAETRSRRDAHPVGLVHHRPLRAATPTLRLR